LIAVVDDEESIRRALTRVLRSAGLAVETFPSGVEFLESIKRQQPDCLVLDLHMPRLSGFEVQTELAQRGTRIPVIVITADDSAEVREEAMAGGPVAFFRKPVESEALLEAIAGVLGPERSKPSQPQ